MKIVNKFKKKFPVDGKWILYPATCTITDGSPHQEEKGYVCHCDDGVFCEDRKQYLADWLKGEEEKLIGIFEKVEKMGLFTGKQNSITLHDLTRWLMKKEPKMLAVIDEAVDKIYKK